MLEDLVKSIRLITAERLSSPLLGAFAVSWLIANFRLVLILLGDDSLAGKLILLEEYFAAHSLQGRLLSIPFLAMLAYVFVYPYPARAAYWWQRRQQNELRRIRKQLDDSTPLTREDEAALRSEMARVEQRAVEMISARDTTIRNLRAEIEALQKPGSPVKASAKLTPSNVGISEESVKQISSALKSERNVSPSSRMPVQAAFELEGAGDLFRKLVDAGGGANLDSFLNAKPTVYQRAILDGLERADLVNVTNTGWVSLTPAGRDYAVKNGFAKAADRRSK